MTLVSSFNCSLLIADFVTSVFKLLKYCSHVSSFIILTQAGFLHYPVEETHISRDLIFLLLVNILSAYIKEGDTLEFTLFVRFVCFMVVN